MIGCCQHGTCSCASPSIVVSRFDFARSLSRLGRSLSEVIQIVDTLVQRKIRFIAINEGIEFDARQDLRTKVMIALFGLFAEVERDLARRDTGLDEAVDREAAFLAGETLRTSGGAEVGDVKATSRKRRNA